jgi:putative copper resistance protein D
VGNDSTTICLAIARATHFAACLAVMSTWAFDRLTMPVLDRAGQDELCKSWRAIARRILAFALPIALLSGAAWLALVAGQITELPVTQAIRWPMLGLVLSRTQFGLLWKWRAGVWMGCVIAFLLEQRARHTRTIVTWIGLLFAMMLVGSLAWSGHGQTGAATSWHLCADVIHLLTGAIWPMQLLPFALVLRKLCISDAPARWNTAANLTRRFSGIGFVAVLVLWITGLVNSWCLLGSFNALWSGQYGRILLLKLAVVGAMMLFSATNRYYLKSRLCSEDGDRSAAATALHRNMVTELALVVVILVLTGLLGIISPISAG